MARCPAPFNVINKDTGEVFPAPCGKCSVCLARRTSHWSFRLMQEDKTSITAHFVTLTYSNDFLPLTKNGFKTLNKKHVQDFMKRLRYYSPKHLKIKYYAAGEYGTETKRPHYHLILFNSDPKDVDKSWLMGSIYYGTVSAASVGYTLKYISKGKTQKLHSRDDRVPEFSLKSTGLGKSYLTKAMVAYHEADMLNRMYCTTQEGIKISMPRYYKDKLYTKEQRQHIGFHVAGKVNDELEKVITQYGINYHRDMAENEAAAVRRLKHRAQRADKATIYTKT